MYQRHLCPSVDAILRPLTHNTAATSNGAVRCLHVSARRCAEDGSNPASAPKSEEPLDTRRTRMRAAVSQIAGLQKQQAAGQSIESAMTAPRTGAPGARRPLIRRTGGPATGSVTGPVTGPRTGAAAGPRAATATPGPPGTMVRAPGMMARGPPGTMARAPTTLRITRTPMGSGGPSARGPPRGPPSDGARGPAGPNLRGRGPRSTGPPGQPGNTGERGPRKRDRKAGGAAQAERDEDVKIEDTLSDGMVQQLLRLQRKMWDRTPYEPEYAHGSKAALALLEEGKKLFAGEVKKVKKPGRLERRIGVVGMHGA